MFPNVYTFFYAMVAALTFFIIGYDEAATLTNMAKILEDNKLTLRQFKLLTILSNVYSIFGSIVAGILCDKKGRIFAIVISGCIFSGGAAIMFWTTSFTMLMVSRLLTGIGIGIGLTASPVYISELSPPSVRGFLTTFLEVLYSVGHLSAYIMELSLSQWRLSLFVTIVASLLIMMIGVMTMPESPYWLLMQGRLIDTARVLNRCITDTEEGGERLRSMRIAVGIPMEATGNSVVVPRQNQENITMWREIFCPTEVIQRILLSLAGLHMVQQSVGINNIIFYIAYILYDAEIGSIKSLAIAMICFSTFKILGGLASLLLMDRLGRRRLLLTSVAIVAIGLAIGACSVLTWHGKHDWQGIQAMMSVICIVTFAVSFSVGLGPIPWFYGSEILPYRLRMQGVCIGIVVNRTTNCFFSMITMPIYKHIGYGGGFVLHATLTSLGFVFCYISIRETRGRNLEQIEQQ